VHVTIGMVIAFSKIDEDRKHIKNPHYQPLARCGFI